MKISKSTNMKNSFSTFEIILAIIVSSIVVIYSMLFIKESYENNQSLETIQIHKLDLLSTKAFLQKHEDLENKLSYKNETLYFEDAVLLKNVKEYKINKKVDFLEIEINLDNQIKQTWKINIK